MKPRLLLNLALMLGVAALILFVIYGPANTTQPSHKPISNLALDTISHIEIRYNNKQKILFNKNDSQWFVQKPFKYRASEFQILSLLSIAHKSSYATIKITKNELSKYGLDKPAYSLTLDNNTFNFGITDPLNFRRYVLFNNTVYLIDDEKYRFLAQEPVKFFSKSLLPPQKTIVKITTSDFTLKKNDQQQWALTPDKQNINADEKNKLIDAWRHAQAHDINIIDNIINPGLQTAIIDFMDKTQLTFHLVENTDQLFFIRNDLGLKFELNKINKSNLLTLDTNNSSVINTTGK